MSGWYEQRRFFFLFIFIKPLWLSVPDHNEMPRRSPQKNNNPKTGVNCLLTALSLSCWDAVLVRIQGFDLRRSNVDVTSLSLLSCSFTHSCLVWILSPSQTQRSPLHSWLRAPGLVHQPARHTRYSRRYHKDWAWPSRRTAEAWKPADANTSTTIIHNIFSSRSLNKTVTAVSDFGFEGVLAE